MAVIAPVSDVPVLSRSLVASKKRKEHILLKRVVLQLQDQFHAEPWQKRVRESIKRILFSFISEPF